jgi:CBS domain-containing protein
VQTPESLLRQLPGCAELAAAPLAALARAARPETFAVGARILTEGEPAPDWYAIVETGGVQTSRVGLESDEILDYLAPGDVLDPGTPRLPALCSAVAAEPTRCVLVPQSAVARHRGSLATPVSAAYGGEMALFVQRVGDLVKSPPVTAGLHAPVSEAAALMGRRGVGSVIVLAEDGEPIGIVTDRDLRNTVVALGLPGTTPLGRVMSAPLVSTPPDRLAFDALLEMTRRGIHHLAVVQAGRLTGVISSHDIVLLHAAHPVSLVRDIDRARSLAELEAVAPRLGVVVQWLGGTGAGPVEIGRIVAELNDRLVQATLGLVEEALARDGRGRAPVPFSWLAAGSEGRREQTLKTDQDNGLVYADPAAGDRPAVAEYFGALAAATTDALARLGFPRCPGGFMASNPQWCQPLATWRGYFRDWMAAPEPAQLLYAALYFDLRPIAGGAAPGRALWEWVCAEAPSHTVFLRYMAKAALDRPAPLGLFGGFVVERGGEHKDQIDLKARGVFPFVQAMRVCALSLGLPETNTVDRLLAARERGLFTAEEARDVLEAWDVIARLRLARQLACVAAGRPPDNFVNPTALAKGERLLLKEAFKTLGRLQRHLEERFQTALVP